MQDDYESVLREAAHDAAIKAGYESTVDYAGAKLRWRDTHHRTGYCVHAERLSTTDRLVLDALCTTGEVTKGQGYHGNDYLAGPAVLAAWRASEARHAEADKAEGKALAWKAYYHSGHASWEEFGAYELEWNPALSSEAPGKFVILNDGLTLTQKGILQQLETQGLVTRPGPGYYAQDYLATGKLHAMLGPIVEKTQEAKSFVNHVVTERKIPPSSDRMR